MPGSDLAFLDSESGQQFEVSLNATDSTGYIEESLNNYPDVPMLATLEVADVLFG